MNYDLPFIPARSKKPRTIGINMIIDKGLSLNQAEDLISSASDLVDYVKLGFGTALVTPNLKDKIRLYKSAGIEPYFGGTLFEAFVTRKMFEEYIGYMDKFEIEVVEVSDGEIIIPHEKKLKYIDVLAKNYKVFSEVGSKESGVIISNEKWVQMMKDELEAGAFKVIAEAREVGNIGIFNSDGTTNIQLIDYITLNISVDNILWEAPQKDQQAWFVKELGAEVNLGNIAYTDVVALETLRLGLRGDTFFQFLPKN